MTAFLDSPDAVIVTIGALVGIASSLLGTFLVLKRNSMLSDAISHAIVLGIVLVFLITGDSSSPFYIVGAALAGVATVALSDGLTRSGRVKNDAAIGLVFPALFALGILLTNLYAREVHIDVHAVLLGEIAFAWLDTVTVGNYLVPRSLLVMGTITLINALFVALLYKELKFATFDEALASAFGFRPALLFYGLLTLLSVTAVGAFDAVGAILLVAFVIVPPATAYLLTDRLLTMILCGVGVAVVSSMAGYALAILWDVSIGGMMATVAGVCLLLAFVFGPRYGLVIQELRRATQRRNNVERTLLVHLYNHEEAASDRENTMQALSEHLRWREAQIRKVVARSLQRELVTQGPKGERLSLTEAGRRRAREVLEPWSTQVSD